MRRGFFPKHFQNSNHLSSKYFRVISLGKKISYAKKHRHLITCLCKKDYSQRLLVSEASGTHHNKEQTPQRPLLLTAADQLWGRHLGPVDRSTQCKLFGRCNELSAHLINHTSLNTKLIFTRFFLLQRSYMYDTGHMVCFNIDSLLNSNRIF